MSMGGLPEGWVATKLGQLVEYGKTQKCVLSDVNADTWVLELEDVAKEVSQIIKRVRVSERPFKSTKNIFKSGDVLYGKLRPYLNKVVMADEDGVCTTEIVPINVEPHASNKFLFYWVKGHHFLAYVNEVSYGVNMPRLGTNDGIAAPLILPPLAEQKIIAEKLDTLLAQVETTKARLERIPLILKRFRQSVLAAAVSGKLTEEWRGGAKFPENQKLGLVAKEIRYGTSKKCFEVEKGMPVLRIPNIGNQKVIPENLKYAEFEDNEILKLKLKAGDILIIRSNGSVDLVGKLAVIRECDEKFMFAGYLIRVRLDLEQISPCYAGYCLSSPQLRHHIELVAKSTSGVNNINSKELANLELPIPSLVEQTQIVKKVEKLFTFADKIEKQTQNALAKVNNLSQSILAKAFKGELTADWRAANPELISGENSAEALLQRIKEEREALSSKKRPVKKNKEAEKCLSRVR